MVSQKSDLTFKHNLKHGRHGWLRLTPAYSVKIVGDILERLGEPQRVLDPFSGTGTTGLVCAERGVNCDLVDINPFLVWLAKVKADNYTLGELDAANNLAQTAVNKARQHPATENLWIPPLHNIERWWDSERLIALARLFRGLQISECTGKVRNLTLVAFCRVAINWSNAAFNHQSMSFKSPQLSLFQERESDLIFNDFLRQIQEIIAAATKNIRGKVHVYEGDSRHLGQILSEKYDCVITSPPYVNRMSYIREVRPYMYWLGFLQLAREAGELDWQAIGGTWGIATSRLNTWKPGDMVIGDDSFDEMLQGIRNCSEPLANYVHKYFLDIKTHLLSLHEVLLPGADLFWIVGNSKFYDTLVPVELIYVNILESLGFRDVNYSILRKRNSKKELHEFLISARAS
ncbi:MAG TPA: SAM-dependent methyltransferase [Oscillatoriaceae cyanobacterium M33_DOE_052]|uniref:site-specific DNA-methyltransferase (cytosine-N(4)-specific) n=1 Tax=Planktothricoides sp. SpSt-374 TaxID=2282167 RepID=A0A7C3ZZ06_9CYAN|nr:SAM-dependent methyltransferase [Oscillatoriaceae cyanobacterium M33_DOE_052]